jgi:selenophosphate synthetase-related protein
VPESVVAETDLDSLVAELTRRIPWAGKQAIQPAAARFGQPVNGDDGALLPNPAGTGWIIIAAEGMTEDFLTEDPWFAGWSAIMANVADITAMGGKPTAAVDVQWSCAEAALDGMAAAADAFGVPVVGGHSGRAQGGPQLAVAMVGHTQAPLSGHGARSGDDLIAVIDQRGAWRGHFPFWNAATTAPPQRLRDDLALIPELAASDMLRCGRDISMGGIFQTAALIAERSGTSLCIDPFLVPGVDQEDLLDDQLRRLLAFPSYGFLLAAAPENSDRICARFAQRGLCARVVGSVDDGPPQVLAVNGTKSITVRDLTAAPLTGFRTAEDPPCPS